MKSVLPVIFAFVFLWGCSQKAEETPVQQINVSESHIMEVIKQITEKFPKADLQHLEKGVRHAASLWRNSDGNSGEFVNFCVEKYIGNEEEKQIVFSRMSEYFESLFGHFNKLSIDLRKNVDLQTGSLHPVDYMFSAYSAGAHLTNDFYDNKIAFLVALNFPYYSTEEKNELGKSWSDLEWAYARMGDVFSSRVPSGLLQKSAAVSAGSDAYIAEYNVFMGKLQNQAGESLFPENMVLLSHWNLRDEIKANYGNHENGLEKQDIIYRVMQRIIDQSIPEKVINSGDFNWEPYENKVFQNGQVVDAEPELDNRYQQIINNFRAYKDFDSYHPVLNTAIKRSFSGNMQIPQEEVEQLFHEFLSAPLLRQVGDIIQNRLGRELKPWDIWYDGFKARSSIPEEKLNAITRAKYPDARSLEEDLGNILKKLGFDDERAVFLASKIVVDPARGSGHAWGASMKAEKAHLRTRIPDGGMDYKGYNIAVHEFGHNVEQTISLHDVPYYMMNGVPNTAFTEALAFVFQERDLLLLGMKDENPDAEYLKTLDNLWSVYEIMGVSMVDMQMWKWMYENPDCTAGELKIATIEISKNVWNQYFAPVFGIEDQTILAIYSHMINSPMYLPNYAFGHLIHFQLEEHFKTHSFAPEVERIFSLGQLTPDEWMKRAVGNSLSVEPILTAAGEAVDHLR
ncbi:hypothetical protein SAMN05444274_105178 [Mariniphaga anaerophila]|uniref:Oligoendopeptidase F n=1 Tax=Mariniphaga anaerophila TaxID=1484053 RepID=A0A1M5BKI4_9BACT|nr:hypothetical protein [Mariniphaga anaerophila]SHF42712.1 hypothetical protein SAMN05444274_105178 [Mariniphaga anaerophila]